MCNIVSVVGMELVPNRTFAGRDAPHQIPICLLLLEGCLPQLLHSSKHLTQHLGHKSCTKRIPSNVLSYQKHGSCSSFVSQRSKLSTQQAKSADPRLISPLSEAPNLHQQGSIREKNKTYDIHTQAYGLTTSFGHGSRHKPCQTCHCSRWGSP